MSFNAFTLTCVYEKTSDPRDKDRFNIQCVECYHPNIYMGTKQGTVHHLLISSVHPSSNQTYAKEARVKKFSSSPVNRIRLVPIYNHLLALSNRTVTVLNMFSLETNPSFKKIQNVSQFELSQEEDKVQMVTCSSQKKVIRVLAVGVDHWDVLKVSIPLAQEPVELAVDVCSACVCVGTSEQYLLCDLHTGHREALFQHGHSRLQVLVSAVGGGEFLLNGPGGLGLFVLASGVCQRPPLHWSPEVLAACMCPPYALSLQACELVVYSLLDQQCKQTVSVRGALGMVPTTDGAVVFTDRSVYTVWMSPVQEQVQRLVEQERLEEALLLLDSPQAHAVDPHRVINLSVTTCYLHFFFFSKGELDPRELLHLFPDLHATLPEHFHPQIDHHTRAQDLRELWRTDPDTKHRYLRFLIDYLRAVRSRSAEPDLWSGCGAEEVDCALLWLYVQTADSDGLVQLVANPNACAKVMYVVKTNRIFFHDRFFALGFLYQSHGKYEDAIQVMTFTEGVHTDPSCPLSRSEVLELVVSSLRQLEDTDIVWKYAPWILHNNQETGVQIFTKPPAQAHFPPDQVLSLLETYPQARIKYLEFLIHETNSEEAGHHTHLALAYVSQSLQSHEDTETRRKLQDLLWESQCYDVSTVYDQIKPTSLHIEKAILLGRTGDHRGALSLLVQDCPDPTAAEEYCYSEGRSPAALDLLQKYPQVLSGEKVLEVMPESWSVQLLSGFLVESIREMFHQSRLKKVQRALEQARLLRHKAFWIQASNTMLKLDGKQPCLLCRKPVTSPLFVHTPSGGLLHLDCANNSGTTPPTCTVPSSVK
uniref:CNH domain-containing protein n=1 Tax=Periophthalmus magnuspinnatus TaxID=409849 RepID=A0A3B4AF46_9GOBI